MVNYLIAATLSNLLVSTILAVIAWVVQRRISSPGLTNLLWAVVLIKMVTPPIVAIPAMTVPSVADSNILTNTAPYAVSSPTGFNQMNLHSGQQTSDTLESLGVTMPIDEPPRLMAYRPVAVIGIVFSVVVSAILFVVSAVRILRFHRLLMETASVHLELSRGLASSIARQFGMRKAPNIVVTSANVVPFVWWMAGRGVIVVSSRTTQELDQTDLRFIITHEMAHIKRRDHWFRWLEWLALIAFWWNPIMWWARQQLRNSEEMACDHLVLQTSKSDVNQYANSLLNMAELLTSPEIRPPVVASAINSGGSFERRLKVMMTEKLWTAPAALQTAVVAMAMCVLPLGFVNAQDFEAVERRLGGAVEEGALSLEQANLMMEALRRSSHGDREMEAMERRYEQVARKIKEAHEAGKISGEEAEEKLIHLRREMSERERHKGDEQREMEAKKRRYEQVAREIEEAHEAGKISEEEAEEKLIHLRREMFERERQKGDEQREMEAKKRRFEQVTREIEEAHEAGKISEEEAEEKFIYLRREIFNQERHAEDESRDMGAQKRRFEQVAREIEEAHEAGKISEEEAEEKFIYLRRKMFDQERHAGDESHDMGAKKRRFEQVTREIKEAHEAGKISEEEAEKKLIHLRREKFDQERHAVDESRDMGAKKRRYEQVTREIKEAHEAGKISEEEAEEKIIHLRRKIFEQERHDEGK